MRPELDRLHQIERHLLGAETPTQAAAWQLQCLLDPDLPADAAAQQRLYAGLQLAGRQQLRAELQAIHRQLYGPPAPGWLHTAATLRSLLRRGLRR